MNKLSLSYIFSWTIFFNLTAVIDNKVVFIKGPSCSGKSTIVQNLVKQLDNEWIIIEYDVIEDLLGRDEAAEKIFALLIEKINSHLELRKNVIVDTNTFYDDQCILLKTKQIKDVFIYAPLQILLQRDALRTKNLSRNDSCAQNAREFVIKNFNDFYPQGVPGQEMFVIDSSRQTEEQAVDMIKRFIV